MAVRQVILGTEPRYQYIRSEAPDDPHDVSKNFVVIPNAQRFVGCLRKSEIHRPREELLAVVDASRIEQFLCSNNAKALAQFGSEQILAAVPTCNREITAVVERAVRPQRHEIFVFIIGVSGNV